MVMSDANPAPMNAPDTVRLIVNADDLGAHPAFTEGILECFEAGALTQSSAIVVSDGADRACEEAKAAGLPTGLHITLMSEWDGLPWRGLTRTMSRERLPPDLPSLRNRFLVPQLVEEAARQFEVLSTHVGAVPHVDCHIRPFDLTGLAALCARYGVVSRDLEDGPHRLGLDSLFHLSLCPLDPVSKVTHLANHLRSLPAGLHMVVAHPGADDPSLDRLTDRSSRRWKWARPIRTSDRAALLRADLPTLCDEFGIQLVDCSAG